MLGWTRNACKLIEVFPHNLWIEILDHIVIGFRFSVFTKNDDYLRYDYFKITFTGNEDS